MFFLYCDSLPASQDHKQEALYGNYFDASWKACFYRLFESNEP